MDLNNAGRSTVDILAGGLAFAFQPTLALTYGAAFFFVGEFPASGLQTMFMHDLLAVLLTAAVSWMVILAYSVAKNVPLSRKASFGDEVFSVGAVALGVTTVVFSYFVAIDRIIVLGAVGVMTVILIGSVARRFLEISGHLLILSFVITGFVIIVSWLWVTGYLLLVPVAWCRIRLRKHTPVEVLLGRVLGIAIPAAGYWALRILNLI